jgi:hypothetical protein
VRGMPEGCAYRMCAVCLLAVHRVLCGMPMGCA